MSVLTGDSIRPGRSDRSRPGHDLTHADQLRYVLIIGWFMVLVGTVLVGARPVELNDLKARVAVGEIDTIRISGALPAGATGYSSVVARWQQGPWRYETRAVQVRGHTGVSASSLAADHDDSPVIHTGLGNQLLRTDPGLRVVHDNAADSVSPLLGWRGPSWLGAAAAALFLLLSGPTPLLPRPKDPTRRLTGGWAFLLAIPLMAALAPYRW